MRRCGNPMLMVTSVVTALAVGCGDGAGTPAPAPASSRPASASSRVAPATSPSPSAVHPAWGTRPTTVIHHPAVPPVPVVTGVRFAAHPAEGFDRIVFDVEGALPGYSVRYVDQVRADPSDRPVTVPGRRHLLVVLTPAQAHRDSGAATVSGVHQLGLPVLRSYAIVGDFEGYVSIAIGVDDVVGYRVAELPGRIYLDVAA